MPFDPPRDDADRPAGERALHEIGRRRQIFSKVSNVLRKRNGQPSRISTYYRPSLDQLWETFGVDRLVYGSNWPVSEQVGPYELVFRIVHEYFATKGKEASETFFAAIRRGGLSLEGAKCLKEEGLQTRFQTRTASPVRSLKRIYVRAIFSPLGNIPPSAIYHTTARRPKHISG